MINTTKDILKMVLEEYGQLSVMVWIEKNLTDGEMEDFVKTFDGFMLDFLQNHNRAKISFCRYYEELLQKEEE